MSIVSQTQPTQLSPAQIGTMLAQRRERAQKEAGNYGLLSQGNGVWSVVSRDGSRCYETTQYACSCPDFQRRGQELGACKHVYLVRSAEEERQERAERIKRNRDEDFGPRDDYDQRPTHTDPFGPSLPAAPEARYWEDKARAAEYADWLSEQMESGLNYPCD